MRRIAVLSFAIVACLASAAHALSIVVGNPILQQNQAGQVVNIYVNADGGEQFSELSFHAQEGDGGSGVGGADVPPFMQGFIDGAGMVFGTNALPVNDNSQPPGYVDLQIATEFGFNTLAAGQNLLATLVFDTTGLYYGIWALSLTGTVGGDTTINGGEPLFIENGQVILFPEPSSAVHSLLAIIGVGAFAIRKRRALQ